MDAPDPPAQPGRHDAASGGGSHLGGHVSPQEQVGRAASRLARIEELRQEREQAVRAAQEQERQLAAVRAARRAAWQRETAEREQMAAQLEAFEAMHVQMHEQGPLQVADGDLMADHADAEYALAIAPCYLGAC